MRKPKPPSSTRSRAKAITTTTPTPATEAATTSIRPAMPSLQNIRERALAERFNINQTITELDTMRNEIDATLAFLKAQRGDK
jgi:hypothetical protein